MPLTTIFKSLTEQQQQQQQQSSSSLLRNNNATTAIQQAGRQQRQYRISTTPMTNATRRGSENRLKKNIMKALDDFSFDENTNKTLQQHNQRNLSINRFQRRPNNNSNNNNSNNNNNNSNNNKLQYKKVTNNNGDHQGQLSPALYLRSHVKNRRVSQNEQMMLKQLGSRGGL